MDRAMKRKRGDFQEASDTYAIHSLHQIQCMMLAELRSLSRQVAIIRNQTRSLVKAESILYSQPDTLITVPASQVVLDVEDIKQQWQDAAESLYRNLKETIGGPHPELVITKEFGAWPARVVLKYDDVENDVFEKRLCPGKGLVLVEFFKAKTPERFGFVKLSGLKPFSATNGAKGKRVASAVEAAKKYSERRLGHSKAH
mmetsp:Transcript_11869/g.20360  ORF Transcript_11869/g.20360 Transcript_11869/m.20360 type:complete len:200 (+) Transcript_11869:52-651(+)